MIENLRVSVDYSTFKDKENELVFQLRDSEFYITITPAQGLILRNLIGLPTFGSGSSLNELNVEVCIYASREYLSYMCYELSFKNNSGTRYNLSITSDESLVLSALFGIENRIEFGDI